MRSHVDMRGPDKLKVSVYTIQLNIYSVLQQDKSCTRACCATFFVLVRQCEKMRF